MTKRLLRLWQGQGRRQAGPALVCAGLTVWALAASAQQAPAAAQAPAATAAASAAQASRQSLLPLARPLWSELNPADQAVLAPFGEQWNGLPLEEKHAWIALATRFPKMGAAAQTRTSARIREWAMLTPEQRRLARQNYRIAKSIPKDERIAQSQQYNTMTDEQKKVLQTSGSTSNTAARHAGSRTALAKEASQPLTIDTISTHRGPALRPPVNSLAPK